MYRKSLVRQMVLHFAALAGWDGLQYTVTLNRRTFDAAAKRSGAESVDYATDLAATLVDPLRASPEPFPLTWVDPAVSDFALLSKICAHEGLHAARPAMRHGRAFDRVVKQLLAGREP